MIAKLRPWLTTPNLVSAIAGLALLAAPWIAGFRNNAIATENAWASGLLILFFILAAVLQLRGWKSWMNFVPGLWVMLSPWLLGFGDHVVAASVHVAIGFMVSLVSMIELGRTETLRLDD